MSAAIFIPWKNSLAELMGKPGGVKVGQALAAAAENLQSIRDTCLAGVDARIADLERLCLDPAIISDDQLQLQIYHAANDICGVAGVFGLGELGEAALCLCELVDRLRYLNRWSEPAIAVHLSALRLLRRPDPDADRSNVVDGLRRLVERVAQIA